jgi:DNA gyrase subunit A
MESASRVENVSIESEMRSAYLDYAMSVIVSRALPDVRDGLKPVHRRLLHAMNELGLTSRAGYRKSAAVVGEVLGKYHPHGEVAIYDTLVRLAQPFNQRYPLIDGQGNFGSVDGDSAAAPRYTECRMAAIADELLSDLDKDTVDWEDNYDGTQRQPVVLPAKLPNLLINGQAGIAVGMATNIPPHNLNEVVDAVIHLLDHPDATAVDLSEIIRGPDFPTGGMILGREGIDHAYGTGRGRVVIRSVTNIEEIRPGRLGIVVTELPYLVNKAVLQERIAELVHSKHIQGISDIRDESDRRGMRLVIELKRDAQPQAVLNQLFKHSALQSSFSINMVALIDKQPRVLNLEMILRAYLEHRRVVVRRRTQFELDKAQARAHILEGLHRALDQLDAIISTIRNAKTTDEAQTQLQSNFGLSEIQARAILDMQLRRLAALERQKILDEHAEVQKLIERLQTLLGDVKAMDDIIKTELRDLKEKFGDARRTRIFKEEAGEFSEEDLIPDEDVVVSMTRRGYIKRINLDTYKTQHRGGKGVRGMGTRDEDQVDNLFVTSTHTNLLFFTNRGRVFQLKVHELPDAGRQAKGIPVINLIQVDQGERVTATLTLDSGQLGGYIVMTTKRGTIKRTDLSQFQNVRRNGLIAVSLNDDDELAWVKVANGDEDIILVTRKGMAITFEQEQVRSMGRQAAGVRGIRLGEGDSVVHMDFAQPTSALLVITERGYGKRTLLSKYRRQLRGGRGMATAKITPKNGQVVAARVLDNNEDELILMSASGMVTRIPVKGVRMAGRATSGVIVMRLKPADRVVSVAIVSERDVTAEAGQLTLPETSE